MFLVCPSTVEYKIRSFDFFQNTFYKINLIYISNKINLEAIYQFL